MAMDENIIPPTIPQKGGATPNNSFIPKNPMGGGPDPVPPPVIGIPKPVMPVKNIGPTTQLKPLRTYESDVADLLNRRGTSALTIALAESKKKTGDDVLADTPEESSNTGKKIFISLLSLILIGGGTIGAYYLYSISPLAPQPAPTQVAEAPDSLIPHDSQTFIELKTVGQNEVKNKINTELAKDQAPNSIKEIIFTTIEKNNCINDNCTGVTPTRIPAQTMLNTMKIPAPDMVARSLASDWMLGIYSNGVGNKSIFVVTTNNFFQNTFAGMLQWENTMPDDLKSFLMADTFINVPITTNNPVVASSSSKNIGTSSVATGSTTATTTPYPSIQTYITIRGKFIDKIIKNKDIREYQDPNGKTIFLYSFISQNMMVVATDENLIPEIMNRLEKRSYMR
jgi:hypothetical protein